MKYGSQPLFGSHYVAGQLARNLRVAASEDEPSVRERAQGRAKKFLSVVENMLSGSLDVGQRQPYADTPTWVTPDVVRGGFATGQHAAGGEWRPHEIALAKRLNVESRSDRTALNGYHLTSDGLQNLSTLLDSGKYRIDVPEEAALLVIRWLLDRQEFGTAAALVESLEPFFDRLRFYARPNDVPISTPILGADSPVFVRSAHSLADGLTKKQPSKAVEAMREHYEVWAPLMDELVALVLETVQGEQPHFVMTDGGRMLVGGQPFARFPADFDERRTALLARVTAARLRHQRCQRIHRKNEVFGLFASALAEFPALGSEDQKRLVSRVRERLAGFLTAYGVPGTEGHAKLRSNQTTGPSHAGFAHAMSQRLIALALPGEGLSPEAVQQASGSITQSEALKTLPMGSTIPLGLVSRLSEVEEGPLKNHIARKKISSGEVLASLLPQLTGPALATRFTDIRAQTIYAASYRAFRRRRSLLLLWLQQQVRFSELPWIAALEACADSDPSSAVQETLRQVAVVTLTSFPETIIPNKLVSELGTLALSARPSITNDPVVTTEHPVWLPLVEELASDIFMGTFSVKFLHAAKIAVRTLRSIPGGDLYFRYYGIDADRVMGMNTLGEKWAARVCPEFDAYCLELAALPEAGNPRARNGAIIEQASILTTHNLAVLVDGLNLHELLAERWAEMAERTFENVLNRLERRVLPEAIRWQQRMRASKLLAFSWRQMIFFLSNMEPAAQQNFLLNSKASLLTRSSVARQRFAPAIQALDYVLAGGALPREASHRDVDGCRRVLGWTVSTPFLMGESKLR
jgi:hypothetical protein